MNPVWRQRRRNAVLCRDHARPDRPTLPVLLGQLVSRPGADNAATALACATLLVVATAVVVTVLEVVRVGDLGEF